ncbi:YceD family protein [Gleimia sp. 6138-11-ORH1]|uniref:YceD family protein n=1 Tax=Gleimia sp. 6138-11-ORH1 TaxID=2973937 RepID=UPI00216A3606|nr:YceD family protein [Gleimia sp. 6138-11-ORH1]MCS4484511.1 YceD family protein [Gleimia sp. 6138-11-ORH1]
MTTTDFNGAKLSFVDLPTRPDHFRDYDLDLLVGDDLGTSVMRVEKGTVLHVTAQAQSLSDGVLLRLATKVPIVFACVRCLDEVEQTVDLALDELFFTPEAIKRIEKAEGEEAITDLAVLEADQIELEPILRDAIIADMEFSPLCEADCPGLCEDCGEPLRDLPDDHSHTLLDPRLSALDALFNEESGA